MGWGEFTHPPLVTFCLDTQSTPVILKNYLPPFTCVFDFPALTLTYLPLLAENRLRLFTLVLVGIGLH